ncbi:hypothetical protein TSOC_014827, partial [Tetrabaena socialis]
GWRKPLEAEDLLPLPHPLACEPAYHHFLRGLSALPEPPPPQQQQQKQQQEEQQRAEPGGKGGGAHQRPTDGKHGLDHDDHPPADAKPPLSYSPEQHLYDTRSLLRLIWILHGPALRRALMLIYAYQTCVFFQPLLLRELTNELIHGQP